MMNRKFVTTADGSVTLYVSDLNEHYHSVNGAVTESMHIFIRQGLHPAASNKKQLRILEFGLGTGLNLLLTAAEAEFLELEIFYHALEKFPLHAEEAALLNFPVPENRIPGDTLAKVHDLPWGETTELTNRVTLLKSECDFRDFRTDKEFDLVYFDAFSPAAQPELWNTDIFCNLYNHLSPGGILVTYSAKGSVRRSLTEAGFKVEKLPGPPGKREFLRGVKP